jgi:hypothetical protein
MTSRAEKAGIDLANSIEEMSNLMYQHNTKANFYKGLMKRLEEQR